MKIYQANNELAVVLNNQDFIETTNEEEKMRGKRSFRLSKHARKKIHFDHINIVIHNGIISGDKIKITERELKLMLLYFKLAPADFNEVFYSKKFGYEDTEKRLNSLERDLKYLEEFKIHKPRQNKIKRILKVHSDMALN